MDVKIAEARPLLPESWGGGLRDQFSKETEVILPVAKTEGGTTRKLGEGDNRPQVDIRLFGTKQGDPSQLVGEIENYLEDLNIGLSFKISDETGDVVVQVLNKDTGDVIRQIPPEALLKLREQLKDLRGTLLNNKV